MRRRWVARADEAARNTTLVCDCRRIEPNACKKVVSLDASVRAVGGFIQRTLDKRAQSVLVEQLISPRSIANAAEMGAQDVQGASSPWLRRLRVFFPVRRRFTGSVARSSQASGPAAGSSGSPASASSAAQSALLDALPGSTDLFSRGTSLAMSRLRSECLPARPELTRSPFQGGGAGPRF